MAERESLVRMCGQPEWELRAEADGRPVMEGYAAVFNEWTDIDSWEGRFRERIHPAAFNRTLKEEADGVQVLFNHGMDPSIGDKPLGRIREIRSDKKGLWVEVPLDRTSYNEDIAELLRSKALRGMSFRMTVQDEKWEYPDEGLPERTIRGLRLYELGPVTFPAYKATQAGVRAHAPDAYMAYRNAHPEITGEEPDEGQAETTPDDGGQAETTPGPESTPEPPATETETSPPQRSRDPKIRELELARMRTVAANRALRLARSI